MAQVDFPPSGTPVYQTCQFKWYACIGFPCHALPCPAAPIMPWHPVRSAMMVAHEDKPIFTIDASGTASCREVMGRLLPRSKGIVTHLLGRMMHARS